MKTPFPTIFSSFVRIHHPHALSSARIRVGKNFSQKTSENTLIEIRAPAPLQIFFSQSLNSKTEAELSRFHPYELNVNLTILVLFICTAALERVFVGSLKYRAKFFPFYVIFNRRGNFILCMNFYVGLWIISLIRVRVPRCLFRTKFVVEYVMLIFYNWEIKTFFYSRVGHVRIVFFNSLLNLYLFDN